MLCYWHAVGSAQRCSPNIYIYISSHLTHLHNSQILQALLDQLLYATWFGFILMFAEGILRPPPSVLSEVVVGELRRLTEKRTELRTSPEKRVSMLVSHTELSRTM